MIKRFNDPFLNQWRHEQEVVDFNTNTVLARYVDFSTAQIRPGGGWYGWKFWLHNEHCIDGGDRQDALRDFRNHFMGAQK